jgi:hypothetical protein
MSFFKLILNKYILIFFFLEFINWVIFDQENVINNLDDPYNRFVISIIVTISAAVFVSYYFHNIQEKNSQDQKDKKTAKCKHLLLINKKNSIRSARILPSEEDFMDDYLRSLSNFQNSLLYFERVQNIIYSNTDLIPSKTLSKMLPIISNFPILFENMSLQEILNARAATEYSLAQLTGIFAKVSNFCDDK